MMMSSIFILIVLSAFLPYGTLGSITYDVRIQNNGFFPNQLTINPGDAVKFIFANSDQDRSAYSVDSPSSCAPNGVFCTYRLDSSCNHRAVRRTATVAPGAVVVRFNGNRYGTQYYTSKGPNGCTLFKGRITVRAPVLPPIATLPPLPTAPPVVAFPIRSVSASLEDNPALYVGLDGPILNDTIFAPVVLKKRTDVLTEDINLLWTFEEATGRFIHQVTGLFLSPDISSADDYVPGVSVVATRLPNIGQRWWRLAGGIIKNALEYSEDRPYNLNLDVRGNGKTEGTPLDIYYPGNSDNQKFIYEFAEDAIEI